MSSSLKSSQLNIDVQHGKKMEKQTNPDTPDRGPIPTSLTTRSEMDRHTKVIFSQKNW